MPVSRRHGKGLTLCVLFLAMSAPALGFEILGETLRGGRAKFKFNPSFPDAALSGTREQQIEIIRAASAAWRDQSRAGIKFVYDGTTRLRGLRLGDGVNVVSWVDEDGDDALALTFIRGVGNRLSGFDMVFFARTGGEPNSWNGPGDPARGTTDISGVAVHEFGHALGLDHSRNDQAVMAETFGGRGHRMRILAPDDIRGVEFLYGRRRRSTAVPVIRSVEPSRGPDFGGDEVVLRGANFTWTADTTLRLDGSRLAPSLWAVESLGLLRIREIPPHEPGSVTITIENSFGQTVWPEAYTHVEPALALTGGSLKRSRSGEWTLKVTEAFFDPGFDFHGGDGGDVQVLLEGRELFQSDARSRIRKGHRIFVRGKNRRLALRLRQRRFSLTVSKIPEDQLDLSDGLELAVLVGNVLGSVIASTGGDGDRVTILPEVGSVSPVSGDR